MALEIFIAYCSPAGSTRKAADMIKEACMDQGIGVHTFDIAKDGSPDGFLKRLADAGDEGIVFVGSPVYRNMAIPPVTDFLEGLPRTDKTYAIPFVTWGQACSGIALWQMGQILTSKGYRLAAGAKILGAHSMMWAADQPPGQGHPDLDDQALLRQCVQTLLGAKPSGERPCLAPETLDYQPGELSQTMKPLIHEPAKVIPLSIKTDLCTQCGLCAESCPVSAIVLDPFPTFQSHCFGCFTCVRECPETAIEPAVSLAQIETMIRNRILTINESPNSQIFLP